MEAVSRMKFLRTPEHLHLMSMLARAREAAGLTQAELAARIGEKQNFISKYERGERRLDFLEVVAIGKAIAFDFNQAIRELEATHGPIMNPRLRKPRRSIN